MSGCDDYTLKQMQQIAKRSKKMEGSGFWKMRKAVLCKEMKKKGLLQKVVEVSEPCVPCAAMSQSQAQGCFDNLCKKYPGITQCKIVGTPPLIPTGKAPVAVAQISTAKEVKAIVTPSGDIQAVPPPAPPPPPPSVLPKIKAPTPAAHRELVQQVSEHKPVTAAKKKDLLAQIQAGKQLKKATAKKAPKSAPKAAGGLMGAIQQAMEQRRGALVGEPDELDDDEWGQSRKLKRMDSKMMQRFRAQVMADRKRYSQARKTKYKKY